MCLSFKTGAIMVCLLTPTDQPESAQLPDTAADRLSPYQSATVVLDSCTWRFHPVSGGSGIRARVERDGAQKEFHLDCNGELDQVVGVVAVGRNNMIGLGAAVISDSGNAIEYRMMFVRVVRGPEPTIDRDQLIWSRPLLTCPLEEPFNMMSIALPAGDSLIFTLESMTRADDTTIETHRFVNHCPLLTRTAFDHLTHHHRTTSTGVSRGETIAEHR